VIFAQAPSAGQALLLELGEAKREIARLQAVVATGVRRYDEQEALFRQVCEERNALAKERDRLRSAIGVCVPSILRCFIKVSQENGADLDVEVATKTLARIEGVMK
jgi:hypothetical protein